MQILSITNCKLLLCINKSNIYWRYDWREADNTIALFFSIIEGFGTLLYRSSRNTNKVEKTSISEYSNNLFLISICFVRILINQRYQHGLRGISADIGAKSRFLLDRNNSLSFKGFLLRIISEAEIYFTIP